LACDLGLDLNGGEKGNLTTTKILAVLFATGDGAATVVQIATV